MYYLSIQKPTENISVMFGWCLSKHITTLVFFKNLVSKQLKTKHQTELYTQITRPNTSVLVFIIFSNWSYYVIVLSRTWHRYTRDDLPSVSGWSGLSAVRSPWWTPARCGCLHVWRTCACWIRPPSTCHTVAIKDTNFLTDLHLKKKNPLGFGTDETLWKT